MDKILILPTRSNPKGRLYNLSKEEAEDIHKKLFSLEFNSGNKIKFQEEIFDKYFNKDPNKYKEFLVKLVKITPNKGDKLFVYAIKSKDYVLLKDLAVDNIVYRCFLKEFIAQFKNCAEQEKEKEKCIQNVVNKIFISNINKYNYHCVKLLLEIGISVNVNYKQDYTHRNTMLIRASQNGDKDIVKFLLENGADPNLFNAGENMALIYASENCDKDIAELLLEKNAKFDQQNSYKTTPLLEASKNNCIEVVKLLLEKGADPNIQDKWGITPLIEASRNNYEEIAKLLLEKGANPNLTDFHKYYIPLIRASRKNNINIVKLLLEKGADPNIQDDCGITPLIIATEKTYKDIVKLLLENGADPNIQNKYGKSAIDYAYDRDYKKIFDELLKYSKEPNKSVKI